MCDTADGFATSNAVLTSRLATYAVLYQIVPSAHASRRSSGNTQCRCHAFVSNACMCSQYIALSAPTCNYFHSESTSSSCRISTKTAQYLFANSDINAMARNPRMPFSSFAAGFFKNTSLRTFRATGAVWRLLSLRLNQPHHFRHEAVLRTARFILHHPPSGAYYTVHCNHQFSLLPICQTFSSTPLLPKPFGLHLRGFNRIGVTLLAVSSHFLRPFFPIFTGCCVDTQLFDNWPVDHLSLGRDPVRASSSLLTFRPLFVNFSSAQGGGTWQLRVPYF